MSNEAYVRIWHLVNPDEVKKHLLIVGHLKGDCANCKHVGIDYKITKSCPSCKTEFRYIATRTTEGVRYQAGTVKKIRDVRSDLVFIDLEDFKYASEKDKAKRFFV